MTDKVICDSRDPSGGRRASAPGSWRWGAVGLCCSDCCLQITVRVLFSLPHFVFWKVRNAVWNVIKAVKNVLAKQTNVLHAKMDSGKMPAREKFIPAALVPVVQIWENWWGIREWISWRPKVLLPWYCSCGVGLGI